MSKLPSRLGRGLGSLIAGGTDPSNETPPSNPEPRDNIAPQKPSVNSLELSEEKGQKLETESENLFELPTDSLVPNPYQPRKVIEPTAIAELAASIESEGLLQPVVARKTGDVYELVAGERRWRAHQYLGKNKILVRLLSASDISSASLSLIENLQREGLNPIEEAMGYNSLINEFNLTQAKVAERVGKSRAHIANLLRILNLDDELKVLLSSQKLSIGHAKVLLSLDDIQARNILGKKVADEGLTVRQCELAVDEIRNPDKFSKQTNYSQNKQFSNFAKLAQNSLKRKVAINSDRNGKGKVSLSFDNESDLKFLLETLGVSIS